MTTIDVRTPQQRFATEVGWLDSHHSFSFGPHYDPDNTHFGLLLVSNDDIVRAGTGFDTHPHRDMEIITIPLQGSLKHKDNMGNEGIITRNEVQVMSAGKGVYHSEHNNSQTEKVSLLQIWVMPNRGGVAPRYGQLRFDPADRKNKWQQIVSPDKQDEGLWIHQQAWFSMADADAGTTLNYSVKGKAKQGIYLLVIEGKVKVDGQDIGRRDAVGITGTDSLDITMLERSELLLLELPVS